MENPNDFIFNLKLPMQYFMKLFFFFDMFENEIILRELDKN